MLVQYPHLAARLQVFTEAFILAIRPAGSPCLVIRASEIPSRILRVSLSWFVIYSLTQSTSKGLGVLKPGKGTVQIGRIFWGR